MKKKLLATLAIAGALFAAGSEPATATEDGVLRVGGSTTLLPVIAKCASDFMEKFGTWDKAVPGSAPDRIVVFVSGGGSGFGVKAAIDGTVHIGLASRHLKSKEKERLGHHQAILVGKDAVVIAANKENPAATAFDGFSGPALADIFSGAKATYKDLDATLPASPVVLLVRDSGAGSAEMFQKLIMGKRTISPRALQVASQGALLKKLETNRKGIGYISSGLAFGSDKLKLFDLDGVRPTNENVVSGKYAFTRPLLMVVKGTPDARAQAFVDYVLSEGQEVVAGHYYVPARRAVATK
jgi:phosphate transport system substrate-binding protein